MIARSRVVASRSIALLVELILILGTELVKRASIAEQMFDDHLVESGVIAIGDEGVGGGIIEASCFFHEAFEGAAAVVEVRQVVLRFGGSEGMNIKADVFSAASETVAFEDPDLIERAAKIG